MFEKKISQRDSIKAFIVNDASGHIDMKATEMKFRQAALTFLAEQAADLDLVNACTTVLFNTHKGASLNQDFIVSEVRKMMVEQVPALNDPQTFGKVKERILDFLKENTGEGKVYNLKMGHGGGYFRASDRPVVAAPIATETPKV